MTVDNTPHVLYNPARAALTGPHAHFAEQRGRVLRYPVDVTPWLALPDEPDSDDWADAATLAGPIRGWSPAGRVEEVRPITAVSARVLSPRTGADHRR
ncbi:hypothetical protein SALBM311S_00304 [Streptomyces alboniger]